MDEQDEQDLIYNNASLDAFRLRQKLRRDRTATGWHRGALRRANEELGMFRFGSWRGRWSKSWKELDFPGMVIERTAGRG